MTLNTTKQPLAALLFSFFSFVVKLPALAGFSALENFFSLKLSSDKFCKIIA